MKRLAAVFMAVALMLTVGSNVYARTFVDHVKVAPNGEGDVIIFPFYLAMPGGWETKLTVTNTSPDYSVVAKVVFRSMVYSEEILDFLLYLTPNDVWTGYIRNSGVNTIIHSTDDSMLAPNGAFASASNPVNQPLFAVTCPTVGDTTQIGYVEVTETWFCHVANAALVAAPNPPAGETWSRNPPVNKKYLKQLYNAPISVQAPVTKPPTGGVAQMWPAFEDRTVNVLAGQMEFQNPSAGLVASMRATVLADYNVEEWLNAAEASGIVDYNAWNLLDEVEAALNGNDYIMSYINDPSAGAVTAHVFTFPTKGSEFEDDEADEDFCSYLNGDIDSAFWLDVPAAGINGPKVRNSYRCAAYTVGIFDLEEKGTSNNPYSGGDNKSRMCEEVTVLDSGSYAFKEGFTRYSFSLDDKTNPTVFDTRNGGGIGTYSGVPALATIVYFKDGGISMKEGARTDGAVVATDLGTLTLPTIVPSYLPEYQYWNMDITIPVPADLNTVTTIGPSF